MKEWILRPNWYSIYATGDGVVAKADNTASGYGNHIVIRHGFGYETLYAHLSKYKARGTKSKTRRRYWICRKYGRSEAPHLHYEVKDKKVVNPINFYYGNISAVNMWLSQLANQENQF
jgi:murein DD-endopeptidase MepM/ murein hydrolase activator NlpD